MPDDNEVHEATLVVAGGAVSEALARGDVEDGDHVYVLVTRTVLQGPKSLVPTTEEETAMARRLEEVSAAIREAAHAHGAVRVDHSMRDMHVREVDVRGDVAGQVLRDVAGFAKSLGMPQEMVDEAVEYAKSHLGEMGAPAVPLDPDEFLDKLEAEFRRAPFEGAGPSEGYA